MRFISLRRVVLILAVCTSAGCYHMYGPYGPCGGYPGNYYGTTPYGYPSGYPGGGSLGAPMQTLTPGQQYFPGTTTTPSSPPSTFEGGGSGNSGGDAQPFGNGTSKPTPDPYFSRPQTFLGPNNSPGTVQELQPAGHQQSSAAQPLVPVPLRPVRPEISGLSASPPKISGSPPSAPRTLERVEASPMDPSYSPPAAPAANTSSTPELQFERPLQASPFPAADPAPDSSPEQPSDPFSSGVLLHKVNPYAYDSNYRWLKGIVSRDRESGSWRITYSNNPAPGDRLAGQMTLAPTPQLEKLRSGDVVQVDGQIDPAARDEAGRPVYLVTHVEKVVQ